MYVKENCIPIKSVTLMGWVYSQADKMLSMNAKNLKIIGSIPHDPLSIKQARSLPSKI